MFVIGGGFTVGWTGSGLDDGARLAEATQSVVVTFSYRLGSLGWAFGNWGMHDQLAVLDGSSARSPRLAATRRA